MKQLKIKLSKVKKKEYDNMKNINGLLLRKLIKEEIKYSKRHFKYDGWDLSVEAIVDNIIFDFIGKDLTDLVITEYLHGIEGLTCTFEMLRGYLFKKEYTPVSYDALYDKFIFGEVKDTLDGKFVYLGVL